MVQHLTTKTTQWQRIWRGLVLLGLSIVPVTLESQRVWSAERITFTFAPFGVFHIQYSSLEKFAKTGEITTDLAYYTKFMNEKTIADFREILNQKSNIDYVTLSRILNTKMGEDALSRFGTVITTHYGKNGMYALRGSIIKAAAEPEGLTILNIIRYFPTEELHIDTSLIFTLVKEVSLFFNYLDAAVVAIKNEASQEVTGQSVVNPANSSDNNAGMIAIGQQASQDEANQPVVDNPNLPDPRNAGSYQVEKKTITLQVEAVRETQMGLVPSYSFNVDVYTPQNITKPAPVVVISHGWGSSTGNFRYLAEHLASYGFGVVVPEHIGSDNAYQQALLEGRIGRDLNPSEFLNRPQDIKYVLDEIAKRVANDPVLAQKIDMNNIGIIGHSFGGYTSLAIAGAPLNMDRLHQECPKAEPTFNLSKILQCRASYVPLTGQTDVSDSRVKAAIAINPITSYLFGPEGLGKITIPTMLISGNHDIAAPALQEQIHPFIWEQNTDKYLALFINGTHFSTMGDEENKTSADSNSSELSLPKSILGPDPAIGRAYAKALSLAFMEVYLKGNTDYKYYLTNNYAASISNQEMPLAIVRSLTPEQLEAAFGKTPPEEIIPQAITEPVPIPKSATVLADIQKTGVLKVGIRKDAAPFGFINAQGEWKGYCQDFMEGFRDYLVANYDVPTNLRVVTLESNLRDRFELVQDQTVHLECGPNSIRKDITNVEFSVPFAATGTQFLIPKNKEESFDIKNNLQGWNVGVLQDSLTQQFMKDNYESVKTTLFKGELGRAEGVQALAQGKIDAFVSDGILLQGEIVRQGLSANDYSVVPERPLTCDFYSMILPNNDPQWQKMVNEFIMEDRFNVKNNEWLAQYLPQMLEQANYCLSK